MLRLNEEVHRLSDHFSSGMSTLTTDNGSSSDLFVFSFDGIDGVITRAAADSANLTQTASYAFGCWLRLGADGSNAASSQPFFSLPYIYAYVRNSINEIKTRFSDGVAARESTYTLGAGFRGAVHFIGEFINNGNGTFTTKVRTNAVVRDSDIWSASPNGGGQSLTPKLGSNTASGGFFQGDIRDPRIYTGTINDADALSWMNGGEPATAVKYLDRGPVPNESGSNTIDTSGNNRVGALSGGVVRKFIF